MKNTTISLYSILFEAEESSPLDIDLGKDVAKELDTSLQPVKDAMKQLSKDVLRSLHSAGERRESPTNARSTKGTTQTSAATTIPKGPGINSTQATTTQSSKEGDVDKLNKEISAIKQNVEKLVASKNKDDKEK